MKKHHPILLFLLLIGSCLWVSIDSYRRTERAIVADLNQALQRTIAEKQSLYLTPDTIATFRSHLQLEPLKQNSIMCYDMQGNSSGLHSKSIQWNEGGRSQAFQGYANCSMATVFSLSDQRPAALLAFLALLCAGYSLRRRKQRPALIPITKLPLTPMQRQLMDMFHKSPDSRLAKQTICDTLWPKKPDASTTLYTLVSRLNRILAKHTSLHIDTERGGDYTLRG